jgi:hypothetical protein
LKYSLDIDTIDRQTDWDYSKILQCCIACEPTISTSCFSLGSQAGKNAPGTHCPPGRSQAFCNGNEYGSDGSCTGYTHGVIDSPHCDQPGFPAGYDVGYHDGYNNAINERHQFKNSCPLGHFKVFCNRDEPDYNRGI